MIAPKVSYVAVLMKFAVLIPKDFVHQTSAVEAKMVTNRHVWGSRNEQVGCGWAGSSLHCAQITLLLEMAQGIPFSTSSVWPRAGWAGGGGLWLCDNWVGREGLSPSCCTLEIPGAGEAEGAPTVLLPCRSSCQSVPSCHRSRCNQQIPSGIHLVNS